jgi:hypothetical protein
MTKLTVTGSTPQPTKVLFKELQVGDFFKLPHVSGARFIKTNGVNDCKAIWVTSNNGIRCGTLCVISPNDEVIVAKTAELTLTF